MKEYREETVLKTFIGKGLMSSKITKEYFDNEIEEVCLELYLGTSDTVYISVPMNEKGSMYTLATAQELAAVINSFVTEIEAAKAGIENNNG